MNVKQLLVKLDSVILGKISGSEIDLKAFLKNNDRHNIIFDIIERTKKGNYIDFKDSIEAISCFLSLRYDVLFPLGCEVEGVSFKYTAIETLKYEDIYNLAVNLYFLSIHKFKIKQNIPVLKMQSRALELEFDKRCGNE